MRIHHVKSRISLFRYSLPVVLYCLVFLCAWWGYDPDPGHISAELTELPVSVDSKNQFRLAMKFLPVVLQRYSHENVTYRSSDFFAGLNMFRLRTNCDAEGHVERTLNPKGKLNNPSVVFLPPPSTFSSFSNDAENMMEHLNNLTSATAGRLKSRKWRLYKEPPSLSPTPLSPSHPWKKFYIAVNLWRNEDIIPYFTGALVAFIQEELGPFFSIGDDVVVTIYSNDSPDETALLIEEFLIPRLQQAGVRRIYATTSGSCLGYYSRQFFHDRIEWLSCVRNKAMDPLYELGMNVFLEDPLMGLTGKPTELDEDELVVLFFNDIFFMPKQITRLLETRPEPVMAHKIPLDGEVSDLSGETKLKNLRHPDIKGFDMACAMDYYYKFYDAWVSRDEVGGPFVTFPPYSDNPVIQRSYLSSLTNDPLLKPFMEGTDGNFTGHDEGVGVKSCWNGVAAIRGRFFLPPTKEVVKYRMDQFVDRLEKEDRHLMSAAGVPVVFAKDPSFYDSVEGHNSLSKVEQVHLTFPLNQCVADYDEAPRLIARPSGAMYQLVDWKLDPSGRERLVDFWVHTLSLRLGYQWKAVILNRMARGGLCEAFPDTDLCFLGPEFMMKVLSTGTPMEGATEAVEEFTKKTREDFLFSWQADRMYEAVYPNLIFRSAVVPSYAARVSKRFSVSHSVCKSSECLLVGEDIMQLTYIQERRSPIILINPNVRVAYEWKHFERAQGVFYSSSALFKVFLYSRRAFSWMTYFLGLDVDQSWRNGNSSPNSDNSILKSNTFTSVRDDWMLKDTSGELDIVYSSMQRKWVYANLTTMSLMHCQMEGSYVSGVIYVGSRLFLRLSVLFLVLLAIQWSVNRLTSRFCWSRKPRRAPYPLPRYSLP